MSAAKLSPDCFVCEDGVELVGDITIGSRTLIHPNVRIDAQAGPIIIGDNNLIQEHTVIINRFSENEDTSNEKVMIIGNDNVFEVGTYSEALKIGDNNLFESKAKIGRNVTISNGCIIGENCELSTIDVLQDNKVVFRNNKILF